MPRPEFITGKHQWDDIINAIYRHPGIFRPDTLKSDSCTAGWFVKSTTLRSIKKIEKRSYLLLMITRMPMTPSNPASTMIPIGVMTGTGAGGGTGAGSA